MASRGGKRPGAGRPRGGNKTSAKVIADAQSSGELPHEFLLRVARGEKIGDGPEGHVPTFAERIAAAKEAAPFYAPRLSTVQAQHGGADGGPILHRIERVIVDPKT